MILLKSSLHCECVQPSSCKKNCQRELGHSFQLLSAFFFVAKCTYSKFDQSILLLFSVPGLRSGCRLVFIRKQTLQSLRYLSDSVFFNHVLVLSRNWSNVLEVRYEFKKFLLD